MDDDFGADDAFVSALAASNASSASRPPRVQQPVPQRLDRPPPPPSTKAAAGGGGGSGGGGVKQPTPQTLPQRSAGSSILVSPRQKGNPVIACLKSVAWEYSDIPADYGLGLTTCALFLR